MLWGLLKRRHEDDTVGKRTEVNAAVTVITAITAVPTSTTAISSVHGPKQVITSQG